LGFIFKNEYQLLMQEYTRIEGESSQNHRFKVTGRVEEVLKP